MVYEENLEMRRSADHECLLGEICLNALKTELWLTSGMPVSRDVGPAVRKEKSLDFISTVTG